MARSDFLQLLTRIERGATLAFAALHRLQQVEELFDLADRHDEKLAPCFVLFVPVSAV